MHSICIFGISYASDSTGVGNATVIRLQLQSIADEVVGKADLDSTDKVSIFVEGELWRSLAENAFIEAIKKRNLVPLLSTGASMSGQAIQIFLLGTDIKVRELDTKLSERTIRTTLEARAVTGLDHKVDLLGTYYRQTSDTAQVFSSLQISTNQKDARSGVLQTLLTPLIVISGAALIIYLFFTVRS